MNHPPCDKRTCPGFGVEEKLVAIGLKAKTSKTTGTVRLSARTPTWHAATDPAQEFETRAHLQSQHRASNIPGPSNMCLSLVCLHCCAAPAPAALCFLPALTVRSRTLALRLAPCPDWQGPLPVCGLPSAPAPCPLCPALVHSLLSCLAMFPISLLDDLMLPFLPSGARRPCLWALLPLILVLLSCRMCSTSFLSESNVLVVP